MKWLVYGYKGWIGNYFCEFVRRYHPEIVLVYPNSRADDIEGVKDDLSRFNPQRVLSFIGRTNGEHFNSIDYLEQDGKLVENVRDNLFSPLVLMKLCLDFDVHLTYLGTGCIFSYKEPNDAPFTTESKPNFFGSSYSIVKGFTDQVSTLFSNVLNVRIRMPIASYDCKKNFVSKIIRYPKIYNTLNSMTVLDDAIPALVEEIINERTGTINLVNPEPIDHVSILELYKQYIDPNHKYELISEEEHDSLLLSKRSKNVLEPSLKLPPTKSSIERIFKNGFRLI
jgi:hypothetical protein